MAKTEKGTTAAAYVRMSTDMQKDSPARQRADIAALAEREGYQILRWYEDHGMTGTESKKRTEFQKLLTDAATGKFEAVLMSEQSRMSREDLFAQMAHWKVLRDAGVKVVTCQQGELRFNDLGDMLKTIVGAHGAHDESRKIADRVTSGLRVASLRKVWLTGGVFGYDRVVTDGKGKDIARVSFRDRYRKPPGCTTTLAISSDTAAVGAIRQAFEAIVRGSTLSAVARQMSAATRSAKGKSIPIDAVEKILRNPLYKGTIRRGHEARGKFFRVFPDGVHTIPNAVPAIVSPNLFDAVQAILRARHQKHTRAAAGAYLLSGLICCGTCGHRLYGTTIAKIREGRKKPYPPIYRCAPNRQAVHAATSGERSRSHITTVAANVEAEVVEIIRSKVLSPANRERIAERAAMRKVDQTTSPDELRLAELQADIGRGERNLTRADTDEDYAAVARNLRELREQAEMIRNRVRSVSGSGKMSGDAAKVIKQLEWLCENFATAPRPQIADALKLVVAKVVVLRLDLGCNEIGDRILAASGVVHFMPDIYPDPIDIPSENLSAVSGYNTGRLKQILGYLREQRSDQGKMMTEIVTDLKLTHFAVVRRNLLKAERLGLVERIKTKTGQRERWRATQAA